MLIAHIQPKFTYQNTLAFAHFYSNFMQIRFGVGIYFGARQQGHGAENILSKHKIFIQTIISAVAELFTKREFFFPIQRRANNHHAAGSLARWREMSI